MKLNKTHLLLSALTMSMKSFMELPNVVNVEISIKCVFSKIGLALLHLHLENSITQC